MFNKGQVIASALVAVVAAFVVFIVTVRNRADQAWQQRSDAIPGGVFAGPEMPRVRAEQPERTDLLRPIPRVPINDPDPELAERPPATGDVDLSEFSSKADVERLLEATWRALEEKSYPIWAAADAPGRERLSKHPGLSPNYTVVSSYPKIGKPYYITIHRSEFPEYFQLLDERDRLHAILTAR